MKASRWFAGLSIAACAAFVVSPMFQRSEPVGFRLREFGRLPVLLDGRIKPLDTVARSSLLIIHGRQTVRAEDGRTISAIEWLSEVLMQPKTANQRKVFTVRNPEILSALGRTAAQVKHFSFAALMPHLGEIERQAALARNIEAQLRSSFQREIVELYERVSL